MKVYIVIELYPYEGEKILGVYARKSDADKAKDAAKAKDDTKGYNEFYVEEHDVT